VTQRTREIGIRIAFGASRREIVALVSRRALVFVSTGLALGLAAALAVTRLLESQLWDVSPTDPTTLGGAIFMLVLVAAAACFVPTRRAVTLNPTTALRE
jgi:ABC-type antimicrobial peptide transport system permease subunit